RTTCKPRTTVRKRGDAARFGQPAEAQRSPADGAQRSVKFDSSLLVVVAIFGVAYFLLKVLRFDRLLRILQARERRVEDARALWQRSTAEVEAALTAERQRLIAARRE